MFVCAQELSSSHFKKQIPAVKTLVYHVFIQFILRSQSFGLFSGRNGKCLVSRQRRTCFGFVFSSCSVNFSLLVNDAISWNNYVVGFVMRLVLSDPVFVSQFSKAITQQQVNTYGNLYHAVIYMFVTQDCQKPANFKSIITRDP